LCRRGVGGCQRLEVPGGSGKSGRVVAEPDVFKRARPSKKGSGKPEPLYIACTKPLFAFA
jgi:hypothetical protein